jgi:hypothetical protein|uniref:Secreted protein n=1 Tax=Picea glauca TaxID=3330 RepID=A0A117NI31_PICGL|nr:hypothetical protein ABT39_MTgene3857 [Picea glauca]QHR86126.1 hypothetical protein Q903MT_gene125 [Picea sitchensis]
MSLFLDLLLLLFPLLPSQSLLMFRFHWMTLLQSEFDIELTQSQKRIESTNSIERKSIRGRANLRFSGYTTPPRSIQARGISVDQISTSTFSILRAIELVQGVRIRGLSMHYSCALDGGRGRTTRITNGVSLVLASVAKIR